MKVNVGVVDRMFRVIIGLALIGLTLTGSIGVWGWLGLIVLVTGIFSYCPAYSLLGIKTCKTT
jgi:hypothetical protein